MFYKDGTAYLYAASVVWYHGTVISGFKRHNEIPIGSPSAGGKYTWVMIKFSSFQPVSRYISEMVQDRNIVL